MIVWHGILSVGLNLGCLIFGFCLHKCTSKTMLTYPVQQTTYMRLSQLYIQQETGSFILLCNIALGQDVDRFLIVHGIQTMEKIVRPIPAWLGVRRARNSGAGPLNS